MSTESNSTTTQIKEHLNSDKSFQPSVDEDYGYFFFPERLGKIYTAPWFNKFTFSGSRENIRKKMCEANVKNALENRIFIKFK